MLGRRVKALFWWNTLPFAIQLQEYNLVTLYKTPTIEKKIVRWETWKRYSELKNLDSCVRYYLGVLVSCTNFTALLGPVRLYFFLLLFFFRNEYSPSRHCPRTPRASLKKIAQSCPQEIARWVWPSHAGRTCCRIKICWILNYSLFWFCVLHAHVGGMLWSPNETMEYVYLRLLHCCGRKHT